MPGYISLINLAKGYPLQFSFVYCILTLKLALRQFHRPDHHPTSSLMRFVLNYGRVRPIRKENLVVGMWEKLKEERLHCYENVLFLKRGTLGGNVPQACLLRLLRGYSTS